MKPHLDHLYDLQKSGFLCIPDEKTGNIADYNLAEPLCFFSESDSVHRKFTVFTIAAYPGKFLFDTLELRFSKIAYQFIQSGPTVCVDTGDKSFRFELPGENCTDFETPGSMLFFKQMVVSLPDVYERITEGGLIPLEVSKAREFLYLAKLDIQSIFHNF